MNRASNISSDSLDLTLTARQAYLCMFEFLRQHYDRGPTDEIGSLLGSLSLLDDGGSADSAQMADWTAAVATVLDAENGDGYHEAKLDLN